MTIVSVKVRSGSTSLAGFHEKELKMKKKGSGLILATGCFMIIIGGCANNEVVKKEEPIAATTKAANQTKVTSDKTQPAKDQPVKPSSGKQNTENDSIIPIQNAAELKADLEKIYFDFDSANLSPDARKSLQKNMRIMQSNSSIAVRIEGNCDDRGSAEYNLALGEKRAKAAMQYLATMGIPTERLTVISYGKERPAAQGSDEKAWSKNRRDEFVIKK